MFRNRNTRRAPNEREIPDVLRALPPMISSQGTFQEHIEEREQMFNVLRGANILEAMTLSRKLVRWQDEIDAMEKVVYILDKPLIRFLTGRKPEAEKPPQPEKTHILSGWMHEAWRKRKRAKDYNKSGK